MDRMMLLLLVAAPMILMSHAGNFKNSYTLKISKDGKDYEERIVVDTRKKTETSHLRQASSGKDEGDIIYDFQRNLVMSRVPGVACFLSQSTGNAPRPADLKKLLNLLSAANVKMTPQAVENFKVVGKLQDRSGLSNEMVDLCANLPIQRIAKGNVAQRNDPEQLSDAQTEVAEMPGEGSVKERRGLCRWVCERTCYPQCSWRGCRRACGGKHCSWLC